MLRTMGNDLLSININDNKDNDIKTILPAEDMIAGYELRNYENEILDVDKEIVKVNTMVDLFNIDENESVKFMIKDIRPGYEASVVSDVLNAIKNFISKIWDKFKLIFNKIYTVVITKIKTPLYKQLINIADKGKSKGFTKIGKDLDNDVKISIADKLTSVAALKGKINKDAYISYIKASNHSIMLLLDNINKLSSHISNLTDFAKYFKETNNEKLDKLDLTLIIKYITQSIDYANKLNNNAYLNVITKMSNNVADYASTHKSHNVIAIPVLDNEACLIAYSVNNKKIEEIIASYKNNKEENSIDKVVSAMKQILTPKYIYLDTNVLTVGNDTKFNKVEPLSIDDVYEIAKQLKSFSGMLKIYADKVNGYIKNVDDVINKIIKEVNNNKDITPNIAGIITSVLKYTINQLLIYYNKIILKALVNYTVKSKIIYYVNESSKTWSK